MIETVDDVNGAFNQRIENVEDTVIVHDVKFNLTEKKLSKCNLGSITKKGAHRISSSLDWWIGKAKIETMMSGVVGRKMTMTMKFLEGQRASVRPWPSGHE